jgi:hypoxanthine phosphoribosyltransferase
MSDLNITWEEYHQSIEQLAEKIVPWEFNQIVCIARGGLRVGDILSRIFDRLNHRQSYDHDWRDIGRSSTIGRRFS